MQKRFIFMNLFLDQSKNRFIIVFLILKGFINRNGFINM